jgi:asparagine synthase (glutamine-hydrolysing)
MCGIVGYSGRFDAAALREGVRLIRHRGPDDCGLFVDDAAGVGLGHARLSIIDLSPLGHQPMEALDGAVQLVFNGEIYNYRALRQELESQGHRFRGHSDTEVLLHLYLQEGESFLPRLNGIFTLAIFDRRSNSLLVARDGLGVKPLYYAQTPRGVAFSSEMKGLLPLIPEATELDPVAIHRYLTFLWCPGEGTPLKAVRKFPPGEAMIVQAGAIERRWTWYRLPAFRNAAADLSEPEAVAGTTQHVRQAVTRQMVADVPVGAFLSGGLDSSAIVAFARESAPDIRCFTIDARDSSEDGRTDDLPYARAVAKHLGVTLDVVEVTAERMAADVAGMIEQLDEPLADPAALNVLYISKLARENGIKVLLSGAGGDDIFSGYRRHHALGLDRLWGWVPRSIRAGIETSAAQLDQRRAWSRRLAKFTAGAGLDGDARIVNYFCFAREAALLAADSPQMRQAVAGHPATGPMLEFASGLPARLPPLERMLALEQRFFLCDHNLTYTDKMSMAVGVEVRVPLLDLDLVDFASRIPPGLKQRGPIGKWVFKKAMEPFLPHDVVHRPKTGFGAPLRTWMRHDLQPLANDLLDSGSLQRRGIFDPAGVAALRAANDAGRTDASFTLFAMMAIELWCRRFVDR